MTETLNIQYHTRRLLLKALNRYKRKVQAYNALGVTEKQLYNMINAWGIRKVNGKYVMTKCVHCVCGENLIYKATV